MAKSPSQQTSGAVSPQAHDKRRQKPRVQVVKEEYPDRTVIIQTEEEDEYVILELPRALEDYKTVTRPGEDPQIAVKDLDTSRPQLHVGETIAMLQWKDSPGTFLIYECIPREIPNFIPPKPSPHTGRVEIKQQNHGLAARADSEDMEAEEPHATEQARDKEATETGGKVQTEIGVQDVRTGPDRKESTQRRQPQTYSTKAKPQPVELKSQCSALSLSDEQFYTSFRPPDQEVVYLASTRKFLKHYRYISNPVSQTMPPKKQGPVQPSPLSGSAAALSSLAASGSPSTAKSKKGSR